MLGGLGNLMGSGMKAANVANQIDAEVKGLISVATNTKMTLQQFDFVESQLSQFGQLLQQENPVLAMQFTNLVQQINNIQGQANSGIDSIIATARGIDNITDKIQL